MFRKPQEIRRDYDLEDRKTIAAIQAAVVEAIGNLAPSQGGVVIVNHLKVQVNYAAGGGASVIARSSM